MERAKFMYVGCGNHRMKGFDHVEINVRKQFKKGGDVGEPEIIADITTHIPVNNNSYDLIFSRATLEHLKYPELINHLLECHRIIKTGGVVRMSVPDFDIMIKNYLEKTEDLDIAVSESEVNQGFPIENHTDLFVNRVLYHDHYYLHNFDTLKRALEKCGFSHIRRVTPGDTIVDSAKDELYIAEEGRDRFEVLIEAQKLENEPQVKPYEVPKIRNIFKRFLAEFLNIQIVSYQKRKPRFPSKYWFYELSINLKKKLSLK